MGLNLDPLGLGDPLDISGRSAAASSVETAQANAELLRKFSDISQENLLPFLELSNRALPGLEQGATPEGFFQSANELRPLLDQFGAPIVEEKLEELNQQLGQSGKTRSGFAATSAADIQEDTDLSILLQLQSVLTGRQQRVAGFGAGSGSNLARLGQRSAEQLGRVQSEGILGAASATAAGQQNFLQLAGLGLDFIPQGATTAPQTTIPDDQSINPFANVQAVA